MRWAAALALAALVCGGQAKAQQNLSNFTVTATTASPGATIPADFIGYSFEVGGNAGAYGDMGGLTDTSAHFKSSNTSMINLIKLANTSGKGQIRFGGGSSENHTIPPLTQGMVDNLHAFTTAINATEANWKVTYGVDPCGTNCATDTSATANTQVGYFLNDYQVGNFFIQIGNEPVSSGDFTNGTYETQWNVFYNTIHTAHATVQFAAWDDVDFINFVTVANALTPTLSGLNMATVHHYCYTRLGGGCGFVPSGPSANALMTEPWRQNSKFFVTAGAANGPLDNFKPSLGSVPVRMIEFNSAANAGSQGYSDRLISSAWFLNYASMLANIGFNGLNLHGGDYSSQTPFAYEPLVFQADGNFAPGAVFYGVYLFSQIEGEQILPISVTSPGGMTWRQDTKAGANPPVTAIAALSSRGSSNKADIIVTNNQVTAPVWITPAQDTGYGAGTVAKVLIVQGGTGQGGIDYRVPVGQAIGSGCFDPSPIMGGQPITESGGWTGAPTTINSGGSFMLPACGSALVQVQ